MPRRTQLFQQIPWIGGVNTSVDPGVLNPQELTVADNVVFSDTGARIKREAVMYFDHDIPNPDFRSSSGTTRTLKWTTNALINIIFPDQRLVDGEKITVTGNNDYAASATRILSVVEISEVTEVECIADVSGSLAGKYFLLSAGDSGTDYYVWYKVSGVGTDPALTGKIGLEVDIFTNDIADDVATATQLVLDAEDDFDATVSTDTVTITNDMGGLTTSSAAGTSGFIVTTTTKGGHAITYTASSSLSESETAASGISITRASSIISLTDYWRWDGERNTQLLIAATDDFQLFQFDNDGRRIVILGQPQVTEIVTVSGGSLTTGDYFLISSSNDEIDYYVWYNVDAGGGDPMVANRTGVEVAVTSGDTDDQVATATKNVLDALDAFVATVDSNTVTVTNADAGTSTAAEDSNTGFTITTTTYGATAPLDTVETIRTLVFQEDIILCFSGLRNKPITYNPDDSPFYTLLDPAAPDSSFAFEYLGRVWMNQKDNTDRIHYSETFDPTLWQGVGDSGALDVGPGDGDPEGITNGYKYKGFIVIGKKAHRYRVTGDSPENFFPEVISDGLGNEGALSIAVDETDVVFLSKRGIHSQAATDTYGDTASAFLSKKIRPTFTAFTPERLRFSQGTFIPELNSFALSISEEGSTEQDNIWLYNVQVQLPDGTTGAWYRWPDLSCQALARRLVDNQYKIIMGTSAGRVVQAQDSDNFADFGTDGIPYMIKTGALYVDQNAQTMKHFKRITLFYRPTGAFSFTVSAKIDNFPSQAFSFTQESGADLLGIDFILGSSILGSANVLAPFTFSMDGLGRGITLTITQPTADEQIAIWGVGVEYESADVIQETV